MGSLHNQLRRILAGGLKQPDGQSMLPFQRSMPLFTNVLLASMSKSCSHKYPFRAPAFTSITIAYIRISKALPLPYGAIDTGMVLF